MYGTCSVPKVEGVSSFFPKEAVGVAGGRLVVNAKTNYRYYYCTIVAAIEKGAMAGGLIGTKEEDECRLRFRCCCDPLRYLPGSPSVMQDHGDCQTRWEEESQSESRKMRAQQYGATFVSLVLLERWLELGTRPSKELLGNMSAVFSVTGDGKRLNESLIRLLENPVDDLKELKNLANNARRLLWRRSLDPAEDSHLQIGTSKIPKAQLGLFAAKDFPPNTICCYYSGDIHSAKSSQSSDMLSDASYLLRIGTVSSEPWWYNALQTDDSSKPLSKEWDAIMEACANTEFFVDPTNLRIKARYINDCLCSDQYNVEFVWDPRGERAAVVTLRKIRAGEELYVSYGQAYWESMEATSGIVPQRLSLIGEENQ